MFNWFRRRHYQLMENLGEDELRQLVATQGETISGHEATIEALQDEIADLRRQNDSKDARLELNAEEIYEFSMRHQRMIARIEADTAAHQKRKADPE